MQEREGRRAFSNLVDLAKDTALPCPGQKEQPLRGLEEKAAGQGSPVWSSRRRRQLPASMGSAEESQVLAARQGWVRRAMALGPGVEGKGLGAAGGRLEAEAAAKSCVSKFQRRVISTVRQDGGAAGQPGGKTRNKQPWMERRTTR